MTLKKNKQNLDQYLDEGNLDLSMMEIQEIPVSGITAITKATSLDLSSNIIVSLPKTFATSLTRLVKLDLSKNGLTNLPENFGLLVNLKHLDLYNNKLESLPLSFANLKSLRWLDVKKNPLMPKLAEIAGLCQDERQCQEAARNIVATFRTMQDQVNAEIARRKDEQLKKLENEEYAKTQGKEKENQPKKKKKKGKNTTGNTNPSISNGNTHLANDVDEDIIKDSSQSLPSVPKKTSNQNPTLLNKVGSALSMLVKFLVTSALLVLFCGFLLSLIDEDLYNSLQKKGTEFIRSNIPKQYWKQWDKGVLKSRKALASWSANIVSLSVLWFNKLQDYYAALSSNEVVQQYLESIHSGWHILWIYLNDIYITVSSKYFNTESESLSGKS